MDKVVFRYILQKTNFYNRILSKGRKSSRDKYIKNDLNGDLRKIVNLDTKFKGKGIEEIIIPSNLIEIYTRLEILLGFKLSGHSDTFTEASNLIDEKYKRDDFQNKQKNRYALDKFRTN